MFPVSVAEKTETHMIAHTHFLVLPISRQLNASQRVTIAGLCVRFLRNDKRPCIIPVLSFCMLLFYQWLHNARWWSSVIYHTKRGAITLPVARSSLAFTDLTACINK
jgi:hypothetical protein